MEIISLSCKETEMIGKKLASNLSGTEIIALFGNLGAGKTSLVRGIALGLNSEDDVTSPTFSIVNEYMGKYPIYHFDMYRINTYEDLYSTGYFDYINNGILIIEWSENIEAILPEDAIKIFIRYGKGESERILRFEGIDKI